MAELRITIVRVYPTCKRVGSFNVRAHVGDNQIRFRGRFRGRLLPRGGYRLIVRVLGAERDAAAVPIVIVRGKMRPGEVRKARRSIVCNGPIADFGSETELAAASSGSDDGSSAGGVAKAIKDHVAAPLTGAASAIARKAKGVTHALKDAGSNAFDDPFVLTLVGLIALASALLGALVLTQLLRSTGFRNRPVH